MKKMNVLFSLVFALCFGVSMIAWGGDANNATDAAGAAHNAGAAVTATPTGASDPEKDGDNDADDQYIVEVAPGFPPFTNVDDPGTPACNGWENNVFIQGDNTHALKSVDAPYFDINYGLCSGKQRIQLKWEGWYQFDQSTEPDGAKQRESGFGNELVGVKWMFLDGDSSGLKGPLKGVSMSVYPQVQFAPSAASVRDGVADGGKIYILPLLVTKEFDVKGRPFGLTMNVGFEHGTGGEPDSMYEGVGLGTAVTRLTSVMFSVSDQQFRNKLPDQKSYQVGVIHVPKHFSKNFAVFAMVGKMKDGDNHLIYALGFQYHTPDKK